MSTRHTDISGGSLPSRPGHEHPSRPTSAKAFSLLELVMVVAILAIVTAIAVPRFGRATARYRADVAARRIANDLNLARKSARTAGADRTVTFSSRDHEYSIAGLPSLDDPTADYRVELSGEPYLARIVSIDFGGKKTLTFDAYGQADKSGTVRVQVGETIKTVTLDANSCEATVQ